MSNQRERTMFRTCLNHVWNIFEHKKWCPNMNNHDQTWRVTQRLCLYASCPLNWGNWKYVTLGDSGFEFIWTHQKYCDVEEVHLEQFHAWTAFPLGGTQLMSIMFRSKRTSKKPTLLKTLVSGQLLAEQWWPEPDSLLMVSRKPGNPNLKPRKIRRCPVTCGKPFRNPWTAGRRSCYCHWPR